MNRPILRSLALAFVTAVVAAAPTASAQLKWQPLYEPGQGGATVRLQVSPHNPSLLISGGDMLGTAVSTDRGETWQSTFGFTTYEMADVTYHPTDPKIVWHGSCSGPYLSTDGGITWQSRRNGMPAAEHGRYTAIVEKVLFDPSNTNRLLAIGGTSRRWNSADTFGWVWESTDGGQNWNYITTIKPEGSTRDKSRGINIVAMDFAAGDPNRLYAMGEGQGVFVSNDSGRTWTKSNAGLPNTNVERMAVHPTDPNTLWVCLGASKPEGETEHLPGGVFKSTDGGKTFVSITGNLPQDRSDNYFFTAHFNALAVSPVDPDVIWVNDGRWNTGTIWKTEDGGRNWRAMVTKGNVGHTHRPDNDAVQSAFRLETATFAGLSLKGLEADPTDRNTVYGFGTEFLLRSTDGGKTWTDITAYRPDPSKPDNWRGRGWTGWCATNFEWSPFKPDISIAQAMDAGRGWISDDALKSWRYVTASPNPWLGGGDASFSADGTIFLSTGQFNEGNGILRSRDHGKTWQVLAGEAHGLPKADWGNRPQYDGIHVHPTNSSLVWAVLGRKLIHSTDGGETWKPVTDDLGLFWIAGDPTNPDRFYVNGAQGIYVFEGQGEPTLIGGPRPAERGRLNCDSLGRVYATQWRNGRPGVWRYTPDTNTWERLLDEPLAFECVADATDPNRLLLITCQDPYNDFAGGNGVWISADAGKTWSAQNQGLPMLRGQAAAINPHDPTQVVVGTFGRGFFVAQWPVDFAPRGERAYRSSGEDTAHAEVGGSILANGAMTEGADRPDAWTHTWGDGESRRDTATFKSAPASLSVAVTGGRSGQAFQQIEGHAGKSFTAKGVVRTQGNARVNVAIMSFDGSWSRNHFEQLRYVQGNTGWETFSKTVTIPDWAARFNVVLLVEGDGKAWLDDVTLKPVAADSPAARSSQPSTPMHTLRDFGPALLDYTYGETWHLGQTVTASDDAMSFNATEQGGGGVVLGGVNLAPDGQTHLAVRLRSLAGNAATRLNVNIMHEGKATTVSFDLPAPSADFTTVTVPLPGGPDTYKKVEQIQFQGANFSPSAGALKIDIDAVGTTKP